MPKSDKPKTPLRPVDVRLPDGVNVEDKIQCLRATSMPRPARRRMAREFQAWKKMLHEWIDSGTRIEIMPDGTWQFIMSPKLSRLVWEIGINERAEFEKQNGSDNPVRDAMTRMSEELTVAARRIRKARELRRGIETGARRGPIRDPLQAKIQDAIRSQEMGEGAQIQDDVQGEGTGRDNN